MTIKYYNELMQGGDEWRQIRRGIITASRVKDTLTPKGALAKNDKSRAIVFQLLAERVTDSSDDEFCGGDMERGNMFEIPAREKYNEKYAKVKECGFVTRDLGNSIIGYSPDGLVGDDGLIEIKCPRIAKHIGIIARNQMPFEYMPQIQAGLFVTKRKWCDFISYFDTEFMYVTRILPDPEWQENIQRVVIELNETINGHLDNYNQVTEKLQKTERAFEELADMGDNYYG